MMITSVIPTPSQPQQKDRHTAEATTVNITPNKSFVFSASSPHLPVVLPASSSAPESFIELFWQMTHAASKRLKVFINQGISIWVEAFSTIATVQQLETQLVESPNANNSYLSPAFKLKSDDAEASLVSSLIAERRLQNTVKPFQSIERDAWLSANQWSGLDDLFPTEAVEEFEDCLQPPPVTEKEQHIVTTPKPVATGSPVSAVSTVSPITASTILGALHEAYPITTPEEEACLKHPLIQRGREVKQNINELVDAYFSAEDTED